MKAIKLLSTSLVAASLAFSVAIAAEEKEEQVSLKNTPAPVQKAIKQLGGELVRIEKETENGKSVYEAVIKKNGKETGYEFDATGKQIGSPHDEEAEHAKKK